MAVTLTTNDLLAEFARRYPWSQGKSPRPTAVGNPTIVGALDFLREKELSCLERIEEFQQATSTITLASATSEYTEPTSMRDRRIVEAFVEVATNDRRILEYKDHTELVRLDPDWDQGEVTGTPQIITRNPNTGKWGFYPQPTAVQTVSVIHALDVGLFSVPADSVHFTQDASLAISGSFSEADWINNWIDRHRTLLIAVEDSSGGTFQGKIVLTGSTTKGTESETIEFTTEATKQSTKFYIRLLSVGNDSTSDEDAVNLSIGIVENYDPGVSLGLGNVRQTSMLPGEWGRRIGPVGLCWMVAEADGDPRAAKFEDEYNRNCENFRNYFQSVPMEDVFMYGRDRFGGRTPPDHRLTSPRGQYAHLRDHGNPWI